MAVGLLILSLVCFILIVVVFVIYFRMKFGNDDDYSDTDVINFMPQYTNNFKKGKYIETIYGERHGVVFMPTGLDYDRMKKYNKLDLIKPQTIFAPEHKIISIPKGKSLSEKNELWILPPKGEDLPESIRKTPFGTALVELIENGNANRDVIDIKTKSQEVYSQVLHDVQGKDMFRQWIIDNKNLDKDFKKRILDNIKQGDNRPPSGNYPPR